VGKSSQRKGRAGEHECANDAKAYGLSSRVHGIYEALDVSIDGEPFEVKRRAGFHKMAYNALHSGAKGLIGRADREQWLITTSFRDWLERERYIKKLESVVNIADLEGVTVRSTSEEGAA
jgi:hypothetical protein